MKRGAVPDPPQRRQYYQHQDNRSIYQFAGFADDMAWAVMRDSPFGAWRLPRSTQMQDSELTAIAHEKAAEMPPPANTTMAHQPKTTPIEVPRLTLVRHEKPIPVSTKVQIVKMSTEVATE